MILFPQVREYFFSFSKTSMRLCYTGNNTVDSIVNIKDLLAQTYGIEFICKINIITEIKTYEMELCRIIGNRIVKFDFKDDMFKLSLIINNCK